MRKKDFFDRLTASLENTKDRFDLDTIHDALIVWFGENYFFLDPEEVKERIVSDKHAEGVDAVLIDNTNYNLLFVQARTVKNFRKTKNNFPENKIKSTLAGIRFLLKEDYKGKITPELENLVDEYHERDLDRPGQYKTIILFLALSKKPIADKFITQFKREFSEEIEIDFWDFDKLFHFYTDKYLTMRALPPQKISFQVLTNLLGKETPIKSRVFTCKGEYIAKIYNDHKERIFQQNVRYSLGLRSKSINKQILETAEDDTRSINFWYFNNGITIVCDQINQSTSGRVIELKNAQIINGAQTTYALYQAYQDGTLRDDVEVLIKAIEANDKNFIESVTLYTNSQNPIRLRDLCSNDEIQIKTQKILLDSYKYFYERKRGEFGSQCPTPAAKRQMLGRNYKYMLLSNENSAQAFLAMHLDKPAQAKSEKGRIFLKDKAGFYEDIFNKNDDILAEKILMSWKLLKYIESHKKEYRKKYKKAENLPGAQRNKIYKYDFLLHGEYFILNLFKDFLKHAGLDIKAEKRDLLAIISKIDDDNKQILKIYQDIIKLLAQYINKLNKDPSYYHNKFFKNEKSIGLIRNFFKQKYDFVDVIQ